MGRVNLKVCQCSARGRERWFKIRKKVEIIEGGLGSGGSRRYIRHKEIYLEIGRMIDR
jgi:hypothetical protein